MRNKSIFKSVLALVLVVVSLFSLFGCTPKVTEPDDQALPNKVESKRYYYQQGYLDSWMVSNIGEDGHKIDETTGLILQLVPTGVKEDGTSDGVAVEGVQYNVWCKESGRILMTSSRNDIIKLIMDEDDADFAFNTINYVDEARESFNQSEEKKEFTAKYSKLQFDSVEFTYTREGEDWKGIYYFILASNKTYFIISYEAKAELYDEYLEDSIELVGDFRKEGWETET